MSKCLRIPAAKLWSIVFGKVRPLCGWFKASDIILPLDASTVRLFSHQFFMGCCWLCTQVINIIMIKMHWWRDRAFAFSISCEEIPVHEVNVIKFQKLKKAHCVDHLGKKMISALKYDMCIRCHKWWDLCSSRLQNLKQFNYFWTNNLKPETRIIRYICHF